MQVLALSVDLSRDAEDVENTLEQVSFFFLFLYWMIKFLTIYVLVWFAFHLSYSLKLL